jgi:hypothetical protein
MNSRVRAILTRLLLVLSLSIPIHSVPASAGTLTIEGGHGLAVPIDFVSKLLPSLKIPKHLSGEKFIESKIEIPYPENSREDVVIAAIPGLLELPTIDYVLRVNRDCLIFTMKSDGEIDLESPTSFSCPPDTLSLVKNRAECSSGGGTWDVARGYPAGWKCIPENRRSCTALGGTMRRVCFSGVMACVKPYKDAGKNCTDGSQCEGHRCVDVGNKVSDDGSILGQCKENDDPCGSFSAITSGKRGARIHVD